MKNAAYNKLILSYVSGGSADAAGTNAAGLVAAPREIGGKSAEYRLKIG